MQNKSAHLRRTACMVKAARDRYLDSGSSSSGRVNPSLVQQFACAAPRACQMEQKAPPCGKIQEKRCYHVQYSTRIVGTSKSRTTVVRNKATNGNYLGLTTTKNCFLARRLRSSSRPYSLGSTEAVKQSRTHVAWRLYKQFTSGPSAYREWRFGKV